MAKPSVPSSPSLSLGVDPDLHDLAFGFWNDAGPVTAFVMHEKEDKSLSGRERVERMCASCYFSLRTALGDHEITRVAVEGQSLKRTGAAQHARPGDIVKLAQVAGNVLGQLMQRLGTSVVFDLPEPEEWKGSVAKHAMQARLYEDLGWGYAIAGTGKGRYARPTYIPSSFRHITKGQWKHVGDALLLARWAHTK